MAHIADIIKYEGDNSTFVWKHPCEDFSSLTQLIVHESQEAIFFMNGQALDLFGPGRHTLETQNIPLLGKLLNGATKGKTPFHCEVYFINKAVSMGMKWGTDSRVHFVDPATGLPLEIGASGEINLQVQDSRKLVIKLVGTGTGLLANEPNNASKLVRHSLASKSGETQKSLQNCFRAPLMTAVKSYLASAIRDQKINILEADAHLDVISAELKKKITPAFEEYGLTVPQFYVTTLLLPEEDKNFRDMKALISQAYIGVKTEEVRTSVAQAEQKRKLVEEQTAAQLRILRAQSEAEAMRAQGLAEAEVMRAKGYSEKDKIEAEVQKAYAEGMGRFGSNIGSGGNGGGVGADIVSMMAGLKVAETMMGKMDNALSGTATTAAPVPVSGTWICTCGESGNTKNFCMNCGQPKPVENKCNTCGAKLAVGAKFCPECGTAINKVCPKCGGQLAGNVKFCPECGEKL